MKKSQILMSLLLVILLSSCYASRITYENLSIIQRGMSSKEVIAIMGKPSYRSFDEESEMLEFRTSESSIAGVVNIWFVDDRVTKMKSYHTNGCMDRNRAIEDKEEEESAKKEKKERECNLNSVWFLFLLNHNKYNFFFLDLQMLLKVVFGCVQGRR
ncbi:hypothetical protein ACMSD6_26440, partial [Bacteroides thetaiotaomicron]|uniref:hypothetical protein n=1 Tax=Bacteroides thetaiotaomicron TaxID=818 RepID=UPI0039C0A1A5